MTAASAPVTIREPTPDDLTAIVTIMNTDFVKPYTPEAFAEHTQKLRQQSGAFHQWVLDDAERRLVGTAVLFSPPLNTTEFTLLLVVTPDARERGYGSALLAHVLDTAHALGAQRLETDVRDTRPAVRDWTQRCGFTMHLHRFESTLDLTAFDETAHSDLEGRLASAGITLQDMGTLGGDEANWTRLYPFFANRNQETPDQEGMPPLTVEQAQSMLRENPDIWPEGTVLATRGEEWLGLSVLMRHPRGAYNAFTGVAPEARGLGLARALKVEAIRRARAAGFTEMWTHNHSSNAPMLAVNRRLGFTSLPGLWVMQWTLS